MGGGFSSLALLQCGHKPSNALLSPWRQITLNPGAGSGKSVALCFFAPNSQVGLPAGISGRLDSLRALPERLSGAAACHLLRAGRGEQGGTASSGRAPSAAAGSGLLPDQNMDFQQRKTSVHGPGLLCYPVGSRFGGAEWMWGVRGVLVPPSSWLLFPHSVNSSAPTRNSPRFRVAPGFWGE